MYEERNIQEQRERARGNNEQRYKEVSKKRLLQILEKKFKTTMIGALAKFEEGFGHIWGHNEEHPTRDQLAYRAVWEEIRTAILNNGNNQLRAAQDELSQHNITKEKYNIDFIIRPNAQHNPNVDYFKQ